VVVKVVVRLQIIDVRQRKVAVLAIRKLVPNRLRPLKWVFSSHLDQSRSGRLNMKAS
jgi:hypothetical protein